MRPYATEINIRNNSGEVMPAFSCCRMSTFYGTDSDGRPIMNVDKPDSNSDSFYLVSHGSDIGIGGFGVAVRIIDAIAVLIDVDNPPAQGDQIGPVNGEWFASTGSSFLAVLSEPSLTGVSSVIGVVSAGGDPIIQFRPTDVCEGIGLTCDCVTAIVVTSSCSSAIQPGEEVQIWDQSRDFFQMDEALLFNSIGWAHKVKVTEEEQYDLPFDVGPCRWVVFAMRCVEQEPLP